MKQDIPELSKARADAMQTLIELAIGEVFSNTEMFDWDKKLCLFRIERSDENRLTGKQMKIARTALEKHGFRVVTTGFDLGGTVLRTFHEPAVQMVAIDEASKTMANDMRHSAPDIGTQCAERECRYGDTAYSLDPDGLCLNCSDDRDRDRQEMDSEMRQDKMT